ncbi:hypothetical protein CN428_24440 [Bacillus cereus]|nr:hypothetical protein CN428_24440 [Bacillus cereus]
MDFIALDVPIGDSFFLYDPKKKQTFLVDGGTANYHYVYNGIVKKIERQLQAQSTTHLDVLICTHYDFDHVSGIIGILNNIIAPTSNLSVGELWLPDFIRRLSNTWRHNAWGIRTRIQDSNFINVLQHDECDKEHKIQRTPGSNSPIDMTVRHINTLIPLCFEFIMQGGKIRWLEYNDNIINKRIDNNYEMFGINCSEVTRYITYYTEKELIFHFTRINQESLVFRYNNATNNLPNVLFTSDSYFDFCHNKPVPFNPSSSIVTTPHHGSNYYRHEQVYDNLYSTGKNFIFVRSDYSGSKRPKSTCKYLEHNQLARFCTNCNNGSRWGDLHFQFNTNWQQIGQSSCQCEKIN